LTSAIADEALICIDELDRACSGISDGHETFRTVLTVRAGKRSALVFADTAEIEVCRTLDDYKKAPETSPLTPYRTPMLAFRDLLASVTRVNESDAEPLHRVGIALGSNLGDRFANIERALRLLEHPMVLCNPETNANGRALPIISVVDTSFMYETAPMYVTEQPNFINCACMVSRIGAVNKSTDVAIRFKQTWNPPNYFL
jgi:dihydroneopterin aldolase / 2-amino-4-hydroxy-6-hydroxymethyldihydropteridine diphosphokinase / dihydropteroate synthase